MQKVRQSPLFVLTMVLLIALAICQVVLPDRQRSDMENRPLAQGKAPTVATALSGQWMRDMETYVSDQFPQRDAWMSLQALLDTALLKNQRGGMLLGREGFLFEQSGNLRLKTAQANVAAMDALADWASIPVTAMIAPLSSAVYSAHLPQGYAMDDPQAVFDALNADAQTVQVVDVLTPLVAGAEEGPRRYYRTDHHWTQAGAEIAYQALCDAWAMSPAAQTDATMIQEDGFYGTYFARAPSPLIQPDTLSFLVPTGVTLSVEGEEKPGLYDPAQMAARDKYAALLYGNHGRITLQSVAKEGTLLVIKDSYANALLPYLTAHFGTIEAVDPRYYAGSITALIEETEADRILCLYGLTTLLTDRNLLLLSDEWGG